VASADLADKTHQRIARLHADGVVPKQKLDEAEAQQQMARKAVEGARASYDMALRGARQEDKMASSAIAQQASNVTAEVSAVERETVLKAPMAGEITEINVDPGELASTGYPIVSIIDLNDIWVTFNIREDILAGLQIGDTIPAILPSQGNRTIALKVDYIKALGDFARWNATKTSGEFDMKTFEVHARPTERINGLRPGMSVIVHWSRHQQKGKKVPPHVRANP
jgi:HlyD family secretion protein